MIIAEYIFWFSVAVLFYTYFGYGICITVLAALKKKTAPVYDNTFAPGVSLIVAAWNEADYIRQKAENMLSLDYPADKIQIIFVTDGSDDGTPDLLKEYPQMKVYHKPVRAGKIAAMERAVAFATNPILIFSDANALLNADAIKNIVKHYANPMVGAVAGEKRIIMEDDEAASGAGEGIYWKYESYLKKKDYEFNTVVGAAGELFSVRTDLFETVEPDTLLDDFMISLRIAQKGYIVAYAPDAFASERPSASSQDEMTRKVRIAAGGIQSMVRLAGLLNPLGNVKLVFQYVSHRVLRWSLAPALLPVLFVSNMALYNAGGFFRHFFFLQCLFYGFSVLGYIMEQKKIRFKLLFVPYYFTLMNVAVYLGLLRYINGSQTVVWKKARRAV